MLLHIVNTCNNKLESIARDATKTMKNFKTSREMSDGVNKHFAFLLISAIKWNIQANICDHFCAQLDPTDLKVYLLLFIYFH